MGRVAILGVFNADTTYRAARQPEMGETILGERFTLGPGGKGSNQAVGAARAGARARMLTLIGRDTFGDMARDVWAEAGVDFAGHAVDGATGAAMIFVDARSGDNAIIVCPGAAGAMTPEHVRGWAGRIAEADVFLAQLEQPLDAALEGLRIARAAGVTTILNPAPAAELPRGMLALADYVTPNESEAALLTGLPVEGRDGAEAAGRRIMEAGAGSVVLTRGGAGAMLCTARGISHFPALSVGEVAETTGAGDAFNGAFAAALSEGAAPENAVEFAIAAAGISVTRAGAAAAMPTRDEIEAALRP